MIKKKEKKKKGFHVLWNTKFNDKKKYKSSHNRYKFVIGA